MSRGIVLGNSSSSSLTQDHLQPLSMASTLHWLFESKGWRDISQEVKEKQLEESTIQQSLMAAVQKYEENPTKENNQQLEAIIVNEITRIEAERDYALSMVKKLQKQMKNALVAQKLAKQVKDFRDAA